MKSTIKNKFAALALPACAALALLGSTASTEAAGYLKIGDIKGESTDKEHKEWINILSVSQSISRPIVTDAATAQRSRGETTLGDVVVVKELDKSSTKLQESCANGTFHPEIEFVLTKDFVDADGTTRSVPYLKYKLKNVLVTSYSMHGNTSGDPLPSEEITLGYTEIEWTYITVDPKTGLQDEPVTGTYTGTPILP